jgi:hypothetical protein
VVLVKFFNNLGYLPKVRASRKPHHFDKLLRMLIVAASRVMAP